MRWLRAKLLTRLSRWIRTRNTMSIDEVVSPSEVLARFVFERRHIDQMGRAKQSAFLPELYNGRLETSVCRICEIAEPRIWALGKSVRRDKTLHARADFPVSAALSQALECLSAPEPNFSEHAVLIGWPPGSNEKMRHKAIAAHLAGVATVLLAP
jgi:hypothetical protein